MEALTISEAFQKAIGSRTVLNAFFSTYCFEPDFFELEVLPILLGCPALSSNETIRYVQLQSLMRDHKDRFSVAYDIDVFNPENSPHLEVDYLPVRVGGGCQHAKLAVIGLLDEQDKSHSILLSAGSFNLTRAGWWENIEVGHWVELSKDYAPPNILNPLLNVLKYFESNQQVKVLSNLQESVRKLTYMGKPEDLNCSFYFSKKNVSEHLNFSKFISESQLDTNGLIEVVSPFFAEDGNNSVITKFLRKFKSVALLLPTDENKQALIDEGVYSALHELPVTWSNWKRYAEQVGIEREHGAYRKLHAKIYQCLSNAPWVFLGSVNLSYKAFSSNVEAGFLLQGIRPKEMLDPIVDEPPKFVEPEKEAHAVDEGSVAMPIFYLIYDWLEHNLELTCSKTGKLKISDSLGSELLPIDLIEGEKKFINLPKLEEHLKRSSLVKCVWQDANKNGEASRNLLISQRNLFCRPSELPPMSLLDLLRIFQGMHSARRTELMAELAARMITMRNDSTLMDENLPPLPIESAKAGFFSEFSQVNGAFWMLKDKLKHAETNGQDEIINYYLKGCQPDSLSGVIEALKSEEAPSLVVRYLTLLSVAELLHIYELYADNALVKRVNEAIDLTEKEPGFEGVPNKIKFLKWIKEKFNQPIINFYTDELRMGDQCAKN